MTGSYNTLFERAFKELGLGLGLGLKDVPTWVTGSYDTPLDRAFKELSNGPISSVQIL